MGKRTAVLGIVLTALLLGGCSAEAPSVDEPTTDPSTDVTTEPVDAGEGDEWQRFRDDPKEAFVFASAYELIMGTPIGNGENADATVRLVYDLCMDVVGGQTWDGLQEMFDSQNVDSADAESYILLAQIYCPEVE